MMDGGTSHSQRGGGGSETAWELSGSKSRSRGMRTRRIHHPGAGGRVDLTLVSSA